MRGAGLETASFCRICIGRSRLGEVDVQHTFTGVLKSKRRAGDGKLFVASLMSQSAATTRRDCRFDSFSNAETRELDFLKSQSRAVHSIIYIPYTVESRRTSAEEPSTLSTSSSPSSIFSHLKLSRARDKPNMINSVTVLWFRHHHNIDLVYPTRLSAQEQLQTSASHLHLPHLIPSHPSPHLHHPPTQTRRPPTPTPPTHH